MLSEREARFQIVEYGKYVYDKGYVSATDGNISIRLGNRIIITPAGSCLGKLKTEDLIIVNMDGHKLEGVKKPTSEILLHLEVYKYRDDIKSVLHAHPTKSLSLNIAGYELVYPILPEIVMLLGAVPTLRYGTPGTSDLFKDIDKYIEKTNILFLDRHGSLCIDKELRNAYLKLEKLEFYSNILLEAIKIGNIKYIDHDEVDNLINRREIYGLDYPVINNNDFSYCRDALK